MIQPKHVPELMRDDVSHRVRQREGRNVRPADSHDASTSLPPAHAERDQVGLRQRDHDVCRLIGDRLEEPRGCRPAAEDCLSACGTQQLVRDRASAEGRRIQVNAPPEAKELADSSTRSPRVRGGTRGSVGSPMILIRSLGPAASCSSAVVSTRPESRKLYAAAPPTRSVTNTNRRTADLLTCVSRTSFRQKY